LDAEHKQLRIERRRPANAETIFCVWRLIEFSSERTDPGIWSSSGGGGASPVNAATWGGGGAVILTESAIAVWSPIVGAKLTATCACSGMA
jgi:hypothetical protein